MRNASFRRKRKRYLTLVKSLPLVNLRRQDGVQETTFPVGKFMCQMDINICHGSCFITIRLWNSTPKIQPFISPSKYLFKSLIKIMCHCLTVALLSQNNCMKVLILYYLKTYMHSRDSPVVRIPKAFCDASFLNLSVLFLCI